MDADLASMSQDQLIQEVQAVARWHSKAPRLKRSRVVLAPSGFVGTTP
jgi:hypothetical protein